MNEIKLLPPYVYQTLEQHGNTVLNKSIYKRLGEKAILDDLATYGFKCRIAIYKENNHLSFSRFENNKGIVSIVIERID